METLTTQLQENRQALDSLLGVGRNYDIISRDIDIGRRRGRMYVIDATATTGSWSGSPPSSWAPGPSWRTEPGTCSNSLTGASPSAR